MSAYGLLEIAVVGIVVGVSAWSVLKPLLRKRNAVASTSSCGSKTDGCAGCGGCGSPSTNNEKPVRFHS